MAQKTLKELEERIKKNRAQIEEDEKELKARRDGVIARAAMMLAKSDPAFKAALDKLMDAPAAAAATATPAAAPIKASAPSAPAPASAPPRPPVSAPK